MARIYGHRWTSSYHDSDDGTWLAGLRDLIPEELAHGLRACIHRAEEWPPTLPEFRRLCLGAPDIASATMHALNDTSRHPAVQAMREAVSSWDQSHLSQRDLIDRYRAAYDDAIESVSRERAALPMDTRKLLASG